MEKARRESIHCSAAVIRSSIEPHRSPGANRKSFRRPPRRICTASGFDGAASTLCDRLASHLDALASAGNIFSRIIREVTGPANRSATLPFPSTTNVSGIP